VGKIKPSPLGKICLYEKNNPGFPVRVSTLFLADINGPVQGELG
jgi:hypothetical protein